MRIKKLELNGFKSFKDRTVIHFDAGITGIVGPNGCGKSNIVDALQWVMGATSAKHLRGSSMEDVIFAGAEGYAPMGMAEVSMTLENDGGPFPAKYMKHSEIMVTRRLHRSGESEYLINKQPSRLRDVHEIFMDTGAGSKGFSIVEQGQIGKIITAKPEDRRVLIEEAAGITKFKVRKRESQRKLVATEQNMVRLQDVLGEQKRQLDSLQRQAQRAERYRKLKEEAKDKELWLSSKNYLKIDDELQEAQRTYDAAKETEASTSSDIGQLQSQLESHQLSVVEKEKEVEQKQTAHGEMQEQVRQLEKDIRELEFEIEQARRNKEMTGSLLQQHEVRKTALESDKEVLDTKVNSIRESFESRQQQYDEKRLNLEQIQARINEVDNELTDKRREMLAVSQSETHLAAKQENLEVSLEQVQERVTASRAVLEELKGQRQEFADRRNKVFNKLESERQLQLDLVKDVESYRENQTLLQQQVEARRSETENFKDQLNEVSSRLYGLENLHSNFEGFQEGVKNVMLWQRQRMEARVEGGGEAQPEFVPISESVEVPEKYELAMEAALGQRLQVLVGDKGEAALEAVDYLKGQKSGRSSFVTSEWNESEGQTSVTKEQLSSEEGVENLLAEVVKIPESHHKQIAYFLKDIVIVDGVRTALRLRAQYPGVTFVTLEGDTLSPDGVLTGGSAESAESGLLKRRREIKELSQKREEWAGKLSLAQSSLKKMEGQLKSLIEDLEQAQKRQTEKEVLIAETKKDFERAENELENINKAFTKQEEEASREESQQQRIQHEIDELKQRLTETREKKQLLEAQVEELTQEFDSKKTGLGPLQQEVTNLQVEAASKRQELEGLERQREMVDKALAEVNEQVENMSQQSQDSQNSLSSNQVMVEQKRVDFDRRVRELEETQRDLEQLRDEFEQVSATAKKVEQKVSASMQEINAQKSLMNEAQLKLEQLKMKEQYILDQIQERYYVDLKEVAHKYRDVEGDVKATEKEVADLKAKLNRIGEVNLSAIEEYDDLISRYEFLKQQFEDLTNSKEQLRKVIDRINRICSRRFKETFEQVNTRFQKVFPVLFGGGEARLILIEDPEKSEMGIDIIAKPPGKKLQNVGLLSGGEKALVAVSLIFSIFLVKPSPYCLLDEVDAPLDDANVFRFNDLVKEMAKRSQIIVVTHNKHTMKVNNKLYGVTMEQKGVSKMVSVSLNEAMPLATTS